MLVYLSSCLANHSFGKTQSNLRVSISGRVLTGIMKASGGDNWSSSNNIIRKTSKVSEEGTSYVWCLLLYFPSNLVVKVRFTKVQVCSIHDCITCEGKIGYLFSSLYYFVWFGRPVLKVVLFLDFCQNTIWYLSVHEREPRSCPMISVVFMKQISCLPLFLHIVKQLLVIEQTGWNLISLNF